MSSKGISSNSVTINQKVYTENIIRVNVGNGISEDFSYYPRGETRMSTIIYFI
jgi:hypothetical protein